MTDKLIDSALMELNRCIRADAGLGPFDEVYAILSRLVQAVREECAQVADNEADYEASMGNEDAAISARSVAKSIRRSALASKTAGED